MERKNNQAINQADRALWTRYISDRPDRAPRYAHLEDLELAAYIDDRATEVERERWNAHMADCNDCRVRLADARDALAEPVVVLPADLREKLLRLNPARAGNAEHAEHAERAEHPARKFGSLSALKAAVWLIGIAALLGSGYVGFEMGQVAYSDEPTEYTPGATTQGHIDPPPLSFGYGEAVPVNFDTGGF